MLITGSCRTNDRMTCPNCGSSFETEKIECPQCRARVVVVRRRKNIHPEQENMPEETDGCS